MTYDAREKSVSGAAPVELYVITVGATEFTLTSADVGGEWTIGASTFTFVPTAGLRRGSLAFNQEADSGSIEIALPRDHAAVAGFLSWGIASPVTVKIYRTHEGETETVLLFVGTVAAARAEVAEIILTCLPMTAALKRAVPRLAIQRQCNWVLYGVGCGLSAGAFTVGATVTGVSGKEITATAFGTKPDGWFEFGVFTGADGAIRRISSHVGTTITLAKATTVGIGDVVSAIAGCDLTEETCRLKFNNLVNHLGFKRTPARNPFVSGLEV